MTLANNSNVIDKWFLDLTNKYSGWGMVIYVILTLLISAILSALIGLERYRRGENAGIRTHALLTIGCSFLMTISIWAIKKPDPNYNYDISRIAAGSVTGIGFLGTGVIIKDKFTVKGLSTATTLWICAAIGLAVGSGFVVEGVIAGAIAMLLVFIRNRIIIPVDENAPHVIIRVNKEYPALENIKQLCDKNLINLKNMDISEINENDMVIVAYFPYKINPNFLEYFMIEMKKNPNVLEIKKVMKTNNKRFRDTHES